MIQNWDKLLHTVAISRNDNSTVSVKWHKTLLVSYLWIFDDVLMCPMDDTTEKFEYSTIKKLLGWITDILQVHSIFLL